jgi:hypothetical protein
MTKLVSKRYLRDLDDPKGTWRDFCVLAFARWRARQQLEGTRLLTYRAFVYANFFGFQRYYRQILFRLRVTARNRIRSFRRF